MVKLFPPGKENPLAFTAEKISAEEFISRAKADVAAEPVMKPINLSLDTHSDVILKELTILDDCSQADAFCAALGTVQRDLEAFAEFARNFSPPAGGSCSRPLRLPLDALARLDSLPRELLKQSLAIKSRSRICRLVLYFTAQIRGLRRFNQDIR